VGLLIGSLVTGGLVFFAVHRHRGARVPLGEALDRGLAKFPRIVGSSLLVGLITLGPLGIPLWLMLWSLSLRDVALLLFSFLGFLVALPLTIYLGVALSLWAPPIMLEDARVVPSLRRSWELTRGKRATLFGVTFVIGLLLSVLIFPVSFAFLFLRETIGGIVLQLVSYTVFYAVNASLGICVSAVAYNLILQERGVPVFPPPPQVPLPQGPAVPPSP